MSDHRHFSRQSISLTPAHYNYLRTCTTPPPPPPFALCTHVQYDTRVIRNKPRNHIAELYTT